MRWVLVQRGVESRSVVKDLEVASTSKGAQLHCNRRLPPCEGFENDDEGNLGFANRGVAA
jgi:hypothetical protein